MALFGKKSASTVPRLPTPEGDPFTAQLASRYSSMVEKRRGQEQGVLRLVTGGLLSLTRPVAVSWKTASESKEIYRGDPNFQTREAADTQASMTFAQFDTEVARLRSQGWWLASIDGRNLIFEK